MKVVDAPPLQAAGKKHAGPPVRTMGLPAGLRHTRNHALGGEFAESHTRHLEAADESTTAAGNTATVGEARRACVTGKEGKADEIALRLQFSAKLCVLFDGFTFALFALEPACFCHRGAESAPKPLIGKLNFRWRRGHFTLNARPLWSSYLEWFLPAASCFSASSFSPIW